MNQLVHELRLIGRSRLSVSALILLFLLSSLAVAAGLHEVASQRQTIERLAPLHEADVASIARQYAAGGEAGKSGYYTFHYTWDAPSDLAFAAIGQRDVVPYVLRIRALGLQAQLYDGEAFNPELALPGRFDFAFVLVYLAPLFVIAMLHDLVSGEREAGRLRLLLAQPGSVGVLWARRTGLRFAMLFAALCLPFMVGAAIAGAGALDSTLIVGVSALYLAFWLSLSLLLGTRASGAANATTLMGVWVILTLVLPTLAHVAINRAVPVGQGIDLMLAQREAVHNAWDVPKDVTMARFFRTHPEWKDTPPITTTFHWKWYYAFQHAGDDQVKDQALAYRAGLASRQAATTQVGWLLPPVGVQVLLHRMADTDLDAQLAYQDSIARFHERIRRFLYPYIFNEIPFHSADFGKAPRFAPRPATPSVAAGPLAALGLLALLVSALGYRRTRRVGA